METGQLGGQNGSMTGIRPTGVPSVLDDPRRRLPDGQGGNGPQADENGEMHRKSGRSIQKSYVFARSRLCDVFWGMGKGSSFSNGVAQYKTQGPGAGQD